MLELVFGPESTFVPLKDPVDRKLHRLIHHSMQQQEQVVRQNGTTPSATTIPPFSPSAANASNTNTIMDTTTDTIYPINGIVVQTNTELPDDVSLATTTGGYNSTVSSDSGGGPTSNTNHSTTSDMGSSIHSVQTDAATTTVGKKVRSSKKKNIRFLFQRSNSLPDNLFQNQNIDTVTEEMDMTDHT